MNNKFISFLLSPVLGLISAFKDLNSRDARIIILLFCIVFGAAFKVDSIDRAEGSADRISMRAEFEYDKNMTAESYVDYIQEYFEFDMGAQDIYITTVGFLVSRFTDNYHYFFLVLAFVFAFFQLKCLPYFTRQKEYTGSIITLILVLLFLWNSVRNINGARYWTAAWIGLYCIFKIFYDKKPRYLLLCLCTTLVHASFIIFWGIVLFTYLTRYIYTNKLLTILFVSSWIFSFFATNVHIPFFDSIDLPLMISRKVEYYTDQEYISSLSQGSGFYWVDLIFKTLSTNYINLLFLLVLSNNEMVDKQDPLRNMLVVTTLIVSVANFGSIVPTFGGRLFTVSFSLIAFMWLVTIPEWKYKNLIYIMPFVWFMNLYYLMRSLSESFGLDFVILSPIYSIIKNLFLA